MRRTALLLIALGLLIAPARAAAVPPIGHVWVVVLENTSYAESFGPDAKVPYFSRDLPAQGALLTQYFGTTHFSLGNYLAMISGQPSNAETQADCQQFSDFKGGVDVGGGVLLGSGCVQPTRTKTLVDQLEAKGISWKGYMEDLANGPGPDTCRHPAVGARDTTQSAKVSDQYATRHNPFMYFHSIIDDQARCDAHVVDASRLADDLASAATTPAFSFVTPNLCDDGHDEPSCVDGRPGGLVAADAYLQRTIPAILASPAYKADGLVLVTFDEAEASGPSADSASCCNQPTGPNTTSPGGPLTPGGGRIGAVALSRFITPGTTSTVPYNHYSFLRSMEDTFGIPEHLGYANQMGLAAFGGDVYSNPAGTTELPMPGMTPPVQSPPVVPTCGTTRLRGKRIAKGDLLQSVVVTDPVAKVRYVRVSMAHGARLSVTQTAGGRTVTLARRTRVRACGQYRYRLRLTKAGRIKVTAVLPTGTERRTAAYR